LTIEIPDPVVILIGVLSFLAGFLYRQYRDSEDIVDAYTQGFHKGAEVATSAISQITGQTFEIDFNEPDDDDS